uniref:Endoglucanase n=1 Tax=Ananas comosus var. bracteatus TaxID=296719 RepID=A0A6V7QG89_ANACO|nr:unnamed protein product [Ananas comosus var. bracteatus]
MAFTTTMLSWGVVEFGGRMGGGAAPAGLAAERAAVRWGADYLLRAATQSPGALYVGVGDPGADHRCWERAEDMDTPRSVYAVSAAAPGSDVAGETAAALAAAAADRGGGAGHGARREDELLWGAAWLYKATNNASYLSYLRSLGANDITDIFSSDNKFAGARVLLSRKSLVDKDKSFEPFRYQAEDFMCRVLPSSPFSTTQYTPGGLMFKQSSANLQYVTSTSFLLTTYAKYMISSNHTFTCGNTLVTPKTLRALAKKQVDYILGENPLKMSYMVGYGTHFPQRIHHRGSSLPSLASHPGHIGCQAGFQYFMSSNPNPNILTGAVIGGPDQNDAFSDDRSNYSRSEPATYINAPLVGTLAYLAGSYGSSV